MLHLSMWVVAATLCQAPAAFDWLDAVPPEADVIVGIGGVESTRTDLVAMLKAMSPALAQTVETALEPQVKRFKAEFGDEATSAPFLTMIRIVRPDEPGNPPFAIVVKSASYEGVLKSVGRGEVPKLKHEDGGYDSFVRASGKTWYAAKGAGTVAFGPDETLIAAYAKPGAKTLGKTLAPALQKQFFHGDVGLYVNIDALSTRYSAQIQQARQAFMAALDQAGQAGNAGMMEPAKKLYAGLFDSLKEADVLALNFDFAAAGLNLGGELTVKADSAAARAIAASQTGDGAGLAKLSADASYFIYMNIDAQSFDKFQSLGLKMIAPGGKPTPEMEAALAQIRGLGRIESVGASSISNGMKTINIINTAEPRKLLAASVAILKAMKGIDGPLNTVKDLRVTSGVETYRGFTFDRVEMTLDFDKFVNAQPGGPNTAAGMKAVFGGDQMTSWYGVSATQLIQIIAPTWDEARSQLDSYFNNKNGLGTTPGFQSIRDQLPKQAGILFLLSTQGLVRQFATQFAAMFNDPNMKPGDLPKEPALIGAALTPKPPTGYEFQLVVPSPVGAVIEKGLVPLFREISAQAVRAKQ